MISKQTVTLKTIPRETLIMKTLLFLVFTISLLFMLPAAFAQNVEEGIIYAMTISPEEPIVNEELEISVGVRNPSDESLPYRLEVIITMEGKIKQIIPFTFSLDSGAGTFLSPTFTPDQIGSFEIIAKLTDQLGINVKDIQIRKTNVVSEIGPFDIIIDTPSEVVVPGTQTPLTLTLVNMGKRGTDVQVKVNMDCSMQDDITQEFFLFTPGESRQDKTISIKTCNEVGLHDIVASIILFNKTWISAINQIFLNQSFIELEVLQPEELTVRAGESKIFDIKVTNRGNTPINNLKLFVPRLPADWLEITPTNIIKTDPNQTVLFIVNITPATTALEDEIDLSVSAAADQVLVRNNMKLNILSFDGTLPLEEEVTLQPGLVIDIGGNMIYIGIGMVAIGGFVGAMKFRSIRRRPHYVTYTKDRDKHMNKKLERMGDALKRKKHRYRRESNYF